MGKAPRIRGARAGHQYQLLGHTLRKGLSVEPYMITLIEDSDVFLYMLEVEVGYRHGSRTDSMLPGESLFFDADVPRGPDDLRKLPIRFLSIICYRRDEEG